MWHWLKVVGLNKGGTTWIAVLRVPPMIERTGLFVLLEGWMVGQSLAGVDPLILPRLPCYLVYKVFESENYLSKGTEYRCAAFLCHLIVIISLFFLFTLLYGYTRP